MLAVLLVALVAIIAPGIQGATIAQRLHGTTIGSLVAAAGLEDTLSGNGTYTLFIPSDAYLLRYLSSKHMTLAQLRSNPEELKDLLLYHVVQGSYRIQDLYNEEKLTALNGGTIRVNKYYRGQVLVQGVAVQSRDYVADNGIIHYIYSVMEPANRTVADIVASDPQLTTLLAAAKAAGLTEFLADQNPITLFAPTDAAFRALGSTLDDLLAKPDLLRQILEYHVVPGTLYTAGIHQTDLHTFEEADKLHISNRYSTYFTVENGHVRSSSDDISATNGVVHIVDHVLIPDSLRSQI